MKLWKQFSHRQNFTFQKTRSPNHAVLNTSPCIRVYLLIVTKLIIKCSSAISYKNCSVSLRQQLNAKLTLLSTKHCLPSGIVVSNNFVLLSIEVDNGESCPVSRKCNAFSVAPHFLDSVAQQPKFILCPSYRDISARNSFEKWIKSNIILT